MQENNKRNKEIITIKVLASAAVLNMLAAGFTLVYSKNQNKEMEATPTTLTTVETKPPYIPAEDRGNEAFKTPFDFDQYAEDDSFRKDWYYYQEHGKLPTPTPPAFMNKGVESQTTATPTEDRENEAFKTPFDFDQYAEDDSFRKDWYYYQEHGKLPTPTPPAFMNKGVESQTTVTPTEDRENEAFKTPFDFDQYAEDDSFRKDWYYYQEHGKLPTPTPPAFMNKGVESQTTATPTTVEAKPPYTPNEDSDEHTRSI